MKKHKKNNIYIHLYYTEKAAITIGKEK